VAEASMTDATMKIVVSVSCDDAPGSTYADPGSALASASDRGSILRCAHDGVLAATDVDRLARTAGYLGATLVSGAEIVRVLYRTERGTEPPGPGFASAVVLLPDNPHSASLPVIVVAHGTVGEAPGCPPSRETPTQDATYLAELGYALVGAGYVVILPDFAGYAGFGATKNPPPGYHASADEAKSVLDAARALRALSPSTFTHGTILVGHSQGGHAVLSALAMHPSYGSGGDLLGVVAYAPSWFAMNSFAAMILTPASFPTSTEADAVAASVWYHYSHAELLDGPGSGPLLFAASKRDAIRTFFEGSCDPAALATIGTTIGDLFDPTFATAVPLNAALGLDCLGGGQCQKWIDRYRADRPHITGDSLPVPVLVVHGDADDWIPPERAKCGFDRLASDGANATVCIVPGAKHDPVVGARAEFVNRWIAWRTLGGVDPGACGPGVEALHDAMGGAAACSVPPPNN
jgi:pimeloyl-ACP methyl ester carboxylesterase